MLYKLLLGLGVVANVGAQLFLKSAMRGDDLLAGQAGVLRRVAGIFGKPFFWLSLALYGMGFLFYSLALSKLELGKAYPVSSAAAIVLITAVSLFFFKESLDILKIVGLALLVAGIFLVLR
jgi:multidrug transporter EmrE-like cation transporter